MNRFRGEIDFPEAGAGVVLRCLPGDLVHFETALAGKITAAADTEDRPAKRVTFNDIVTALQNLSAPAMMEVFAVLAKVDGKSAGATLDDIDVPWKTVSRRCLDALFLAVHGKSFEEFEEEFLESMKKALAAGDGTKDGGVPAVPTVGSET